MVITRSSGSQRRNDKVREMPAAGANLQWLRGLPAELTQPGAVLLFGGVTVVDFRIRVAQSHLRRDLLPSFWSHVGILVSSEAFLSVPLDERLAPSAVPGNNAITECPLSAYDDPQQYPNIAVVQFTDRSEVFVANAQRLRGQRGAIDLPHLLISWLAYGWGAGTSPNPLTQNVGLPASAMVETVYGMSGIELTPGVASAASCPEAVWQSAIWWHDYYEKTLTATVAGQPARGDVADVPRSIVPTGAYAVRQPAAAASDIATGPPARTAGSGTTSNRPPRKRAAARRRSSRR